MSQARFSVRTAVAEGYAFWRGNVLKAIGPLLIATAGLAVLVTARDLAMLVGGLAVYLASDASRFHTGDSFVIDGGYAIF